MIFRFRALLLSLLRPWRLEKSCWNSETVVTSQLPFSSWYFVTFCQNWEYCASWWRR